MSKLETKPQKASLSVIIPCYMCSDTIIRAVKSVAMQTLLPQEIILVNDGSCDDGKTLAKLYKIEKEYKSYFGVKVITLEKNSGVAVARNTAWKVAQQPYIAFLDADDAWHPRKVELQYEYMVCNPEVSLSGHAFHCLEGKSNLPGWDIDDVFNRIVTRLQMLRSNQFITPSVMLKKDIPFRFSESKRYMEDHLLWSQIVCSNFLVVKISVSLAATYKFSYGVGGLSGQYKEMRYEEVQNYKSLYMEKRIGWIECQLLFVYSFVKYCRRLLVILLRCMISKR